MAFAGRFDGCQTLKMTFNFAVTNSASSRKTYAQMLPKFKTLTMNNPTSQALDPPLAATGRGRH